VDYSFTGLVLWLTGLAAAAAVDRSFRSGLWACAWATVLGVPLLLAAWLAQALVWYQQGAGCSWTAKGGSAWAATWALRSGGPCRSCCGGPFPRACSARPPGARLPAAIPAEVVGEPGVDNRPPGQPQRQEGEGRTCWSGGG
jgi:hypothetical protein